VADPYDRSIPTVVRDLLAQIGGLMRNEGKLARAELSEKVGQFRSGLVLALVGTVMALPALTILLGGVAGLLARTGLSIEMSALLVGAAILLLSAILLGVAIGRMKAVSFVPTKTLNQLRRDAAVVNIVRPSHEQRAA
jgi:hypothetical protein